MSFQTADRAPGTISLADCLLARQAELEELALARIQSLLEPAVAADPSYVAGLRAALAAAVEYGLSAVVRPGREPEPVPVQVLAQARLAARDGVRLEGVLRRYAAGHSLLIDKVIEVAATAGFQTGELREVLHAVASRYDRIVAAVTEEYGREVDRRQGRKHRRYSLVRRLLGGETLDTSELDYELAGHHHVAIVATGAAVAQRITRLAETIDRRLLLVCPEEQIAWAWFGGRRPITPEELDLIASHSWEKGDDVASGMPGPGPSSWRLSHSQAAAAFAVVKGAPRCFVNYSDVTLLSAALQDDLLQRSLRRQYLEPLSAERDGGEAAKQTLRAYFAAGGNVSSAAAALGVTRSTVRSRLLAIEQRYGRPLDTASAEIELSLQLDQLGSAWLGRESTPAPDARTSAWRSSKN